MFFRKSSRALKSPSSSIPPEKLIVKAVIEWIASDAHKLQRLEKAYNVQGAQAVLQTPKLAQTIGLMEDLVRHWLQGNSREDFAKHLASIHQQYDVYLTWFLDAVRIARGEAAKIGAPEAFSRQALLFQCCCRRL